MKMYICHECGAVMDEREATVFIPQIHDELPERAVEMISELRCIHCGADTIEEAEICSICDEYYPKTELSIYGVCPDCQIKIATQGLDSVKALQGFAKENWDAFTEYVEEEKKKNPTSDR